MCDYDLEKLFARRQKSLQTKHVERWYEPRIFGQTGRTTSLYRTRRNESAAERLRMVYAMIMIMQLNDFFDSRQQSIRASSVRTRSVSSMSIKIPDTVGLGEDIIAFVFFFFSLWDRVENENDTVVPRRGSDVWKFFRWPFGTYIYVYPEPKGTIAVPDQTHLHRTLSERRDKSLSRIHTATIFDIPSSNLLCVTRQRFHRNPRRSVSFVHYLAICLISMLFLIMTRQSYASPMFAVER